MKIKNLILSFRSQNIFCQRLVRGRKIGKRKRDREKKLRKKVLIDCARLVISPSHHHVPSAVSSLHFVIIFFFYIKFFTVVKENDVIGRKGDRLCERISKLCMSKLMKTQNST